MSWLVKEVLVSHSELSLLFFCGVEGSEESRWPTPRCGHGRGQLVCVYEVEILQL